MNKEIETLTYDAAQAELQQIVTELQSDTISMDELAAKIERARELIRFCRERLREVEKRLSDSD